MKRTSIYAAQVLCFLFSAFALSSCNTWLSESQSQRRAWQQEMVSQYCPQVFNQLAPPIPQGVEPIIERENPYPALPDYRMFPDVSLKNQNALRLGMVAKCLHKQCLTQKLGAPAPEQDQAECGEQKSNFVFESFASAFDKCSANPYLRLRVTEKVREIYQEKEAKSLRVCPELIEGKPELAQALNLPLRECSIQAGNCPMGLRCAISGAGTRCIEEAEIDLGKIGTRKVPSAPEEVSDKEADYVMVRYTQKAVGALCSTSRECADVASCISLWMGPGRCRAHCKVAGDCMKTQACFDAGDGQGVCAERCSAESLESVDGGNLCVPTEQGGILAEVDGPAFMKMLAAFKATSPSNSTPKLWTASSYSETISRFKSGAVCGNGQVEFPETCDAGDQNGVTRYGGWCTKECEQAECGNAKIEGSESCECLPGYAARAQDGSRMMCPHRWAQSDKTEKAIGWTCDPTCQIYHSAQGIMNVRRSNPHFLPEFICAKSLDAQGKVRPECRPTKIRDDYKERYKNMLSAP